jgi:NADPH:quinone reductase-like Zn-dependent oxidoreductase
VLGTGGVSLFAAQFARGFGAEVWATTSNPAKRTRLTELGVTGIVDYDSVDTWGQYVFDATGGARIVVNSAGGRSLDESIAAVAFGGEIAYMGLFDVADRSPDLLALMSKAASIRGVAVGSVAAQNDMVSAIDAIGIRPVIDEIVGFSEAPAAYERHISTQSFGKVVVQLDAAREENA